MAKNNSPADGHRLIQDIRQPADLKDTKGGFRRWPRVFVARARKLPRPTRKLRIGMIAGLSVSTIASVVLFLESKPKRQLTLKAILIGAAVLTCASLILAYFTLREPNYELPPKFTGNYKPLFPGRDYSVTNITTGEQRDVILYETYISDHRVAVTQQPIPKELDFKKLMSNSKYVTKFGTAEIINSDDYTQVSLITDSHWFILHSQGKVLETKAVHEILDSLQQTE